MNYSKLDAKLSAALAGEKSQCYAVFLFLEGGGRNAELQRLLRSYGVLMPDSGVDIVTARLSGQAIDELSNQPEIRYIELSGTVNPLSHGER